MQLNRELAEAIHERFEELDHPERPMNQFETESFLRGMTMLVCVDRHHGERFATLAHSTIFPLHILFPERKTN